MLTREAFLRTICEHPDDDVSRLVYADWLDDNGDDIDRALMVQFQARHKS
jgi:uncharacterized protein (TIGR02996 family)